MRANPSHRLQPLAFACAALLGSVTAEAAAPAQAELLKRLEQMNARLEKLELRNSELERQARAQAAVPEVEKRLQSLEDSQAKIARGLDSDRISENEPELTARLKAVENDALSMKKAAKKIDALDGIKAGASLTTVAQGIRGLPHGTSNNNSQLNYRADVTVELPLKPIGNMEHKLFGHFRIGQGEGLNNPLATLGAFAGAANAVAFRASGLAADDSVAILGEAWYQATIPLPFGGYKPHSRENMELTFGKMDIFGFFDQNAVAGDESRQYLNSVFVHNPLLDAGGQVGVDANGFQPGFVIAYNNESNKPQTWRLSLGVFGTGDRGANYQRSLTSPLVMAQAETKLKFFGGLTGNYRLYAWHQSRGNQLDGTISDQSGWGVSADQKLGDGISLFGRYGSLTKGKVNFDRALTLGSEFNGTYWGRSADAIGIAAGWLHASQDFHATTVNTDLNGDGIIDYSYTPNSAEHVAELYYRYRINPQVELTPDFQYIGKLGGNSDARAVKVLGLRAQFAF